MKREHKIAAGLGPALVILIVIAVFSYRSTTQLIATTSQVEESHEVLETLEDVFSHTLDAESAARGYTITGDVSFLEPYRDGSQTAHQDLSRLRALTAGTPAQQRRLKDLESLVEQKLTWLERVVYLRQNQGFEAAASQTRTTSGKQVMDEIRLRVDEMQGEDHRRRGHRSDYPAGADRYHRRRRGGFIRPSDCEGAGR